MESCSFYKSRKPCALGPLYKKEVSNRCESDSEKLALLGIEPRAPGLSYNNQTTTRALSPSSEYVRKACFLHWMLSKLSLFSVCSLN